MSDRQLTTFPILKGYEQAVALLEERKIPFESIVPPGWLAHVAVPGIVVDRNGRGRWADACGGAVACCGWVEYRPFGTPNPDPHSEVPGADVFGNAAITVLQPCVADNTKLRVVAVTSGDLEPVLPYLNATMQKACYNPQGRTLTYMEQHRMVVLYPRRITIAKVDNLMDSWLCLERLRLNVNRIWERRGEIEPCYETRKKPPALEVFKRLPGTNCRLCGELTCMAFALRLWAGEVRVRQCTPVFLPEHEDRRTALLEICAGLGIMNE